MDVKVKRLRTDATLPTKAHDTDAGFDLYALEDTVIEPGETALVKTGIALGLPAGYEAQIRPRSGVTLNTALRVQIGTIDAGYNGDVGVIVDNISEDTGESRRRLMDIRSIDVLSEYREYPVGTYYVRKHDRIAQLVIQRLPDVKLTETTGNLDVTDRADNGFGSSGTRDNHEGGR